MIKENKEFAFLKFLDYKDVRVELQIRWDISHSDLARFLKINPAAVAQMSRGRSRQKRLLMMLGLAMLKEKGVISIIDKDSK